MTDQVDPRSDEVRTELERVARRWQQLPWDHALRAAPGVRALVDELARELGGPDVATPPDLGPVVLVDQLRVLTWDACAAGLPGIPQRLVALRRALP